MASFAEVAAQTESVIPLPSSGESSDDFMRTSSNFHHQQAAADGPSQTIFATSGLMHGDTQMQTQVGAHYIPAQPTMTPAASSRTETGASGALSALAALATSAAMQRDTPLQQQLEGSDHHQIMHSSAPIAIARNNTITPHQTSSDDDSEAMPPPPPRIPTAVPPLQPQPYPTSVDSEGGFTSILAFHNNDGSTSLLSSSPFNQNSSSSRRVGGRIRSVSNPEGMEKWDSYTRRNDRMHFVLPSSILEEELASTKRMIEEKKVEENYVNGYIKKGDAFSTSPFGAMMEFSPDHDHHHDHHNAYSAQQQNNTANTTAATNGTTASRRSKRQHKPKNIFGTSPDSVSSDLTPPVSTSKSKRKNQSSSTSSTSSSSSSSCKSFHVENLTSNVGEEEDEDIDESLLEPEELLRRARSRLLEDLSEGGEDGVNGGGLNGEKGVLTLPHSLGKYKEVRKRERPEIVVEDEEPNFASSNTYLSNSHHCCFVSFLHRFTTKMDASEFTLQPNEQPSFKNSTPNVPVACGTRRFGIIVVRIWQIEECVSKVGLSSGVWKRQTLLHHQKRRMVRVLWLKQ